MPGTSKGDPPVCGGVARLHGSTGASQCSCPLCTITCCQYGDLKNGVRVRFLIFSRVEVCSVSFRKILTDDTECVLCTSALVGRSA